MFYFYKVMKLNTYNYRKSRVFLSLFVLLYVCAFVIPDVSAETRSFINTPMCVPKQRVYNCSFQFSSLSPKACQIYRTDDCIKKEFPSWNLQPLIQPLEESDAGFTVSILPYSVIVYPIMEKDPLSAVNILLTSFNKSISGYSILMTNNGFREWPQNQNICRIIDFRNSLNEFSNPFKFMYDCFHKLTEDFIQNVTVTFTAFPLNTQLSYFLYIPPVPNKNSTSPCDWKPLVMVSQQGLIRNHIRLKFSNDAKDMGILYFVVTLMDDSDTEVKSLTLHSNVKNEMISVDFQPKTGGYYSFSINVIDNITEKSCKDHVYRSHYFFVGPIVKDYSLIIFTVLLVVLAILASVFLYISCQWYLKSVIESAKPTLLLVYFHRHHHHKFLNMYAEYLEKHYGVITYPIYKRERDAEAWRVEAFSKANIIVFVISEGLFQNLDKKLTLEGDHYWVDQLTEVIALINETKGDGKHFCSIYFPYSGKQHVPKCLKYKGPLFKLPKDNDKFLCFIFNCSSKYILNTLCCIKHYSLLKSSSAKKDDDKKLKEELENIIKSDDIHYAKNESNSNNQNVWKKQLNLDSESYKTSKTNYKMNNEIGEILMHDSNNVSRNYSQNECEKPQNTSNEKNNSTLSNGSADESVNENTVLVQLEDNYSHVKDNNFISCTSKMINFEYGCVNAL